MFAASTVWPLTGRQASLQQISDAMADGRTRGVLVLGPAGVGKTRIADAICDERERTGGAVARVTATAQACQFPLAALAPLLLTDVDEATAIPRDPVLLLAHLRRVLHRPAAEPTPLLFVDDLPQLDPLSSVMVSQLVESRTVVLLATVRAGDPLPEMYRGVWSGDGMVKVELGPLSDDDCARLLRGALGATVATKSVVRLHAMSGGIPLHLRELVMSAIANESLCLVEGVWQLSSGEIQNPALERILATRVGQLEPRAADLLRRIAVCQPLEVDDLTDEDGALLPGLEEACLIRVDPGSTGDWIVRPAHPAYADIIRSSTPRVQIRRLLLDQIAVVQSRDRGPRDVARLAMWQLEATGRADPAVLIAAATIARRGHEFAAVRRLAAAAVHSDPQPSAEALLLLGEATRELGDSAEAGDVLDAAHAAGGSPEIRARIAVARAGLACHGRNLPDAAEQLLSAARDAIPEESEAISLARAVMLTVGERTGEAMAEVETIDPRRGRSPRLVGLYTIATVGTLVSAGRPGDALAIADELLPLTGAGDNLFHDGMPRMLRASALLELHGPDHAIDDATTAMRECLRSGVDRLICFAASQAFAVQLAAGRPRSAARWAREIISVARSSEHRSFLSVGMSNLACALAVTGDAVGARSVLDALHGEGLERTGPDGETPTFLAHARAWTLAAEGRLGGAAAMLIASGTAAIARGQLSVAGTLLHDAVRVGGARSGAAGLADVAALCQSPQVARQSRHATAYAAGDVDALCAAAEEWDSIGSPLLAAEAFLTAARAARRQDSGRRAVALTARGSALAARCQGARTPDLTHGDPIDPLSPREREVAGMAARGLRSREIADALVVSIRTVDNHLQSVYAKLGIAGRGELASALQVG